VAAKVKADTIDEGVYVVDLSNLYGKIVFKMKDGYVSLIQLDLSRICHLLTQTVMRRQYNLVLHCKLFKWKVLLPVTLGINF